MKKRAFIIIGSCLLFFLVIGFVGALLGIISLPGHVAQNAADTANGIVDKTINTDNVLSNYEEFHDLYQGAKQQVANIQTEQKHLQSIKDTYGDNASLYPKDVREDIEFTQETIDGQVMQYQSIVAKYNANSKKQNRNLFKDKGLPAELPTDYTQLE